MTENEKRMFSKVKDFRITSSKVSSKLTPTNKQSNSLPTPENSVSLSYKDNQAFSVNHKAVTPSPIPPSAQRNPYKQKQQSPIPPSTKWTLYEQTKQSNNRKDSLNEVCAQVNKDISHCYVLYKEDGNSCHP